MSIVDAGVLLVCSGADDTGRHGRALSGGVPLASVQRGHPDRCAGADQRVADHDLAGGHPPALRQETVAGGGRGGPHRDRGDQRAPLRPPLAAMRDTLADGLPGGPHRRRVAAAVDLALAFPTWHSLTRVSGLTTNEAARLMARMVSYAGGPE
jgi:hypothetical protein